jgi:hypothetical protein
VSATGSGAFPAGEIADRDFSGAVFRKAAAAGRVFRSCRFVGCLFVSCDLQGAVFEDCDLTGARFTALPSRPGQTSSFFPPTGAPGARFERCSLAGASFSGLILEGCVFEECDLRDASFLRCRARRAAFVGGRADRCRFGFEEENPSPAFTRVSGLSPSPPQRPGVVADGAGGTLRSVGLLVLVFPLPVLAVVWSLLVAGPAALMRRQAVQADGGGNHWSEAPSRLLSRMADRLTGVAPLRAHGSRRPADAAAPDGTPPS